MCAPPISLVAIALPAPVEHGPLFLLAILPRAANPTLVRPYLCVPPACDPLDINFAFAESLACQVAEIGPTACVRLLAMSRLY